MGPTLGENTNIELRVEAEGWPLPAFQWLRNGKKLPGETSNVLQLRLHCPISNKTRSYRCSQCKNFCRNVPKNAYQIMCTNCGNQFDYKEVTLFICNAFLYTSRLINTLRNLRQCMKQKRSAYLKSRNSTIP